MLRTDIPLSPPQPRGAWEYGNARPKRYFINTVYVVEAPDVQSGCPTYMVLIAFSVRNSYMIGTYVISMSCLLHEED